MYPLANICCHFIDDREDLLQEVFVNTVVPANMSLQCQRGAFWGYCPLGVSHNEVIPQKISEVGHVRMFAALASVASISILLHSLHIGFITWIILRLITGFCFVGLYTVAESWINDSTDNEHRGQALSVYMIVGMAGNSIGHLLLNISDPQLATQFMVVSILISISLVFLVLI